jgi:hypothetical protein
LPRALSAADVRRRAAVDALLQFDGPLPLAPSSSPPLDPLGGDLPLFALPAVHLPTPPPLPLEDWSLLPPPERKAREAAAKLREQRTREAQADLAAREQNRLALLDQLMAGGGVPHSGGSSVSGVGGRGLLTKRAGRTRGGSGGGRRAPLAAPAASPVHRTAGPFGDRAGSPGGSGSRSGGGGGGGWASERGDSIAWLRSALAASEAVSGAIRAQTQDAVCELKGVKGLPLPTSQRARRMMVAKGLDRLTRCVQQQGTMRVAKAWTQWRCAVRASVSAAQEAAVGHGLSRQRLAGLLRACLDRLLVQGWAQWWAVAEALRRAETWQEDDAAARLLQNVWRGRLARLAVARVKAVAQQQRQFQGCVKLQASLRGKLARRRVGRFLSDEHRAEASEVLQRAWRCRWAKTRVRQKRAQRVAACALQRYCRGAKGRTRFHILARKADYHAAASSLQRLFRGGRARRQFLWLLRRRRRRNGALFIQRCYRGMRGRWVAHNQGSLKSRRGDKVHSMATKIQRRWRRRGAEHALAGRATVAAAKAWRATQCAILVQTAARRARCGRSVRKLLKKRAQRRLAASRACVETWSELIGGWVYLDAKTGAEWLEPPATGYTKQSGLLVLETGQVVGPQGQPLPKPSLLATRPTTAQEAIAEAAAQAASAWTETPEEEAARLLADRPKCVEFPHLPATRWDAEWDEPFSEPGWALAHSTEYPSIAVYAVALADARCGLAAKAASASEDVKQEEGEKNENDKANDDGKPEVKDSGGSKKEEKKKKKLVVLPVPAATRAHLQAAEAVLAKAVANRRRKLPRPRRHAFCRIFDDGHIAPHAEDEQGGDLGPYDPGCGGRSLRAQQAKAAAADPNWQSYGLTQAVDAGGGAWTEHWDDEAQVPYW